MDSGWQWTAPESDISCRCVWTSSTSGRGFCLNHSLNGALLVTFITSSVEWLQLSLQSSKEKMILYSARSEWEESTSSGDQDAKPLKPNFSSSFSCLCAAVSFMSGCPGPHPVHLSCQTTPAAHALSWQPPILLLGSSSGSKGMPYCFSPQWQHSCCHCTFLCRHSVLSNLGAVAPHQHIGHESSHSTLHWWMQSSSMHVWFWIRRHQLFPNLWW